MGHGHGPHDPYKVPSADSFKIENAPELLKYQEQLNKAGLKDPWIRNHIWRYDKRYGTMGSRWFWLLFRGIPTGAALFGLTLGIEHAFGIDWHAHHHAAHDDHSESH